MGVWERLEGSSVNGHLISGWALTGKFRKYSTGYGLHFLTVQLYKASQDGS